MIPSMRRRVSSLLCLSLFAVSSLAAPGAGDVVVAGRKGEQRITTLASLPRSEVTVSDHGTAAKFEGVELETLLESAGAPAGEHIRGKELAKYVVVEGRDGYRAVFALAELSRAFTDRKVILADRRDGKTLSGEEGPFRVVVEGEKRMARCVRQVKSIRIAEAK
jgi:hypothetical protein